MHNQACCSRLSLGVRELLTGPALNNPNDRFRFVRTKCTRWFRCIIRNEALSTERVKGTVWVFWSGVVCTHPQSVYYLQEIVCVLPGWRNERSTSMEAKQCIAVGGSSSTYLSLLKTCTLYVEYFLCLTLSFPLLTLKPPDYVGQNHL